MTDSNEMLNAALPDNVMQMFNQMYDKQEERTAQISYSTEMRECYKHGLTKHNITHFGEDYEECFCLECEKEQRAKLEKEQEEKAQKEIEELRNEHIAHCKACNIEPEYYDFEFSSYHPQTPAQQKALDATKKMVAEKHGKVILLGPNGVGKTALASIAAKSLNGKIYTMYEISCMIRQCYSSLAKRPELEIVEELASIPFLAIDELGRSKGSDAELNWLSYILDKRHTRRLPFMLLTNGHFKKNCPKGDCPNCFENFVDNDVLSRLLQDSTIISIKAPDNRRKNHQVEFFEDKEEE